MEKFAKLLQSKAKSQKPMSGPEMDAKKRAVHEMRKMASDEMATPLHNLKKVTVASNSPEGVKVGLDKAKEMLNSHEEGSPEEEASESPEMEKLEEETGEDLDRDNEEGEDPEHVENVLDHDMSPQEIQEKIMELQKLLAAKKS